MVRSKCYHRIAELKAQIAADTEFVPGIAEQGEFIPTREAANEAVRKYVADEQARKESRARDRSGAPD